MTNTRREFAPEFKREAVAMLEGSGRPIMQVAAELGIAPSMLRNWRRVMSGGAPRSRGTISGAANVSQLCSLLIMLPRMPGSNGNSTGHGWSAIF